jgi:large subunit ribosomal protein L15
MPPKPRISALGAVDQLVYSRNANRLQCLHAPRLLNPSTAQRAFTTTPTAQDDYTGQWVDTPRWKETPTRMRAPVSLKKHDPENRFSVNESQELLDEVYRTILGEDGDKLLTDEVKWLAVTHKSFDQGRRGYNDRLAFLGMAGSFLCKKRRSDANLRPGKRIVDLQTSLALLNRTDGTFVDPPDEFEREPFRHPGVDLLPRLSDQTKGDFVSLPRIASMAHNLGLTQVVRWKPRKVSHYHRLYRVCSNVLRAGL